ncbi:Crp/Fnr family transcriptional regulator [Mucilaginibacter polytrichastri]|uniref:HTH crp-type domain-containing protein n=1 Tax=Mucilaginibacter polytrichastri TaxID=1302689 RepID=A0A1Q5ZYA3_9SPHI|nr:Crp/Fnr family transcriptional regulator [Mucilaginibacter polytrichastri]OKS86743.1 hypothetical protein RG47T_2200 [Mucilaginibacter polytrichastri]SFS83048.1 hypothetical protein SAMN04487890_104310 [Mucilaginibacter polytrichastri]
MLNLIKFKDKKVYFEEYIPAFGQVVEQLGIKGVNVKFVSEVVANIVAIQALEDSTLYYVTLADLKRLFDRVPKFERFFRILTQNGFDMFQRRLTFNLSKTAEQRYREFRRHYPRLEQRISQKHIASYLGITAAFLSMMRKEKDLL